MIDGIRIKGEVDAEGDGIYLPEIDESSQQQLAMLYELPLSFTAETDLERLFQLILDTVVAIIPTKHEGEFEAYCVAIS